jgi:hypothetical protein
MNAAIVPILAVASSLPAAPDTIVRIGFEEPRWAQVEETLSIGTRDGDPNYTFFGVTGLAIGVDGSIVVLEAALQVGTPRLRLYDAEGRYVHRMGGPGQGPGEFMLPAGLASMPDGRFLLVDPPQRRLTVYSAEGTFEESWAFPHHAVSDLDGSSVRVSPDGIVALRIGGGSQPPSVVRLTLGGAVIDTLAAPGVPDLRRTMTITEPSGRRIIVATPYQPDSRWTWHPHGYFVTARTDRYAIDLHLPRRHAGDGDRPARWRDGDPVLSIRASVDPVEILDEERRDQQRYIDERIRRAQGERTGTIPPVPAVKPFLNWIFTGMDGRIWVHVHSDSERVVRQPTVNREGDPLPLPPAWRSTLVWDVFEPNGHYRGRVRFPDALSRPQFRGDEAWGFVHDDLGIPTLKRYRIHWPDPT